MTSKTTTRRKPGFPIKNFAALSLAQLTEERQRLLRNAQRLRNLGKPDWEVQDLVHRAFEIKQYLSNGGIA